jgi:hypothetical protein
MQHNRHFQGHFEGRASWSDIRKRTARKIPLQPKSYATSLTNVERKTLETVLKNVAIKAYLNMPLNVQLRFEDLDIADRKLDLPIVRLYLDRPLPKLKWRIARTYEALSKVKLSREVQNVIDKAITPLLLK